VHAAEEAAWLNSISDAILLLLLVAFNSVGGAKMIRKASVGETLEQQNLLPQFHRHVEVDGNEGPSLPSKQRWCSLLLVCEDATSCREVSLLVSCCCCGLGYGQQNSAVKAAPASQECLF
jgi:hypothetical protein